MEYKNYIAFDFGSSSVKVNLAVFNGKKIILETLHGFENIPVQAGNYLQWDILKLYYELCLSIRKAFKKCRTIESIGIDAWGGDFGFIDKKGYLLGNPLHYRNFHNRDSEKIFESLYGIISKHEIFKLTGIQFLVPGCNLYQMHELVLSKSRIFSAAFKYLMIPDLLNYYLTGTISAEYTVNSMSQLMDQENKRWSAQILEKIGVPESIFPGIVDPGTSLGFANKTALNFIDCPKFKVTAPAEHDTSSAFLSIPVSDSDRAAALISMGSWSVLGTKVNKQVLTKEAFDCGFSNQAGPGGCFYFFKNMTGLWPAQQCRRVLTNKEGRQISWDEIDSMVESAENFNCFINVDDPLFGRVSKDMRKDILGYIADSGQNVFKDNAGLFRCLYESLSLRFRYNIELLEKILGEKIGSIYLAGGGSKNKTICQFTANLLNVTVISGIYDASSLGNIISQMVASGEVGSFKEGGELVKRSLTLNTFYPEETGKWDDYYRKYIDFIKKMKFS